MEYPCGARASDDVGRKWAFVKSSERQLSIMLIISKKIAESLHQEADCTTWSRDLSLDSSSPVGIDWLRADPWDLNIESP